MAGIKKLFLGDRLVEADVMDFEEVDVPWTKIKVEDETLLEMKYTVSEVLRIRDQYTDYGEPLYIVRSQNVLRSDVPEKLLRSSGKASE